MFWKLHLCPKYIEYLIYMFKREIFKDVQQKNFVSYLYNNMGEGFLLLYYMTMKDYKQSIISVQRIGPC